MIQWKDEMMSSETVLGKVTREPLEKPLPIEKPEGVLKVELISDEVTAVCPITGQRDFYTIHIIVIPREQILESKSLKLYFSRFANEGIFCESLSAEIARTIFEVLQPHHVTVTVTQKSRGGISIISTAVRGE